MPGIISAMLATLLQLAVGIFLAALITDWRGQVTRGFLFIAAVTALVSGILAFGLAGLGRVDGGERWLQAFFLIPLLVYSIMLASARRTPRLLVGLTGLAFGMAALILAAMARPSEGIGQALTAFVFVCSALALGTGINGLLLGHWYLTTPNLTSSPLRMLCDLLLLSLVPLSGFAVWYLQAAGGSATFAGLSGPVLWVGAGMITLFPFAVTVAARICCIDGPGRGRSIQAATGLLYLVAAAVLAGGLAGNAVLLGA